MPVEGKAFALNEGERIEDMAGRFSLKERNGDCIRCMFAGDNLIMTRYDV